MSDIPDIKSALQALNEAQTDGLSDGLSPWHRVAVLLVSLGKEAAADVLRQFSQEEVRGDSSSYRRTQEHPQREAGAGAEGI